MHMHGSSQSFPKEKSCCRSQDTAVHHHGETETVGVELDKIGFYLRACNSILDFEGLLLEQVFSFTVSKSIESAGSMMAYVLL
jgi:hypothetical protein